MDYKPNFTITPEILANITEIAEIKTIVDRSSILPQREAILRRRAAIRMAHTSTKIEGNQLAEYEVQKVLSGENVNADEESIAEVRNYNQALNLIDELQKQPRIEINTILNLHKLVMKGLVPEGSRGHWRPNAIYIVTAHKDHDEVHYTGPDASEIPQLLTMLLEWVYQTAEQQRLQPILVAGILHYLFESIHPFTDGNGRTGRLITLLYVLHKQWGFKKLITLENYYSKHRVEYITQLQKTGDTFEKHLNADLTEWLEFFTRGYLHEANQVKEQILPITLATQDSGTGQIFLDKDELKLLDFIATMGQMTSGDAADILTIPKRTAQAKIKSLVDQGVIIAHGKGPSTFYTLTRQ